MFQTHALQWAIWRNRVLQFAKVMEAAKNNFLISPIPFAPTTNLCSEQLNHVSDFIVKQACQTQEEVFHQVCIPHAFDLLLLYQINCSSFTKLLFALHCNAATPTIGQTAAAAAPIMTTINEDPVGLAPTNAFPTTVPPPLTAVAATSSPMNPMTPNLAHPGSMHMQQIDMPSSSQDVNLLNQVGFENNNYNDVYSFHILMHILDYSLNILVL